MSHGAKMGQPINYYCLLLMYKIIRNAVFPLFLTAMTILTSPFLRMVNKIAEVL